MSGSGGGVVQSPTFPLSPSSSGNSPGARAPLPSSPGVPPPTGEGGGYPVVPANSPAAVVADAAAGVASPLAVFPSSAPAQASASTPLASSWSPTATAPSQTVADIVATWTADADHTVPPDSSPTATPQIVWSPTSLLLNGSLPDNSTLANSILTNGTSLAKEIPAPTGLAIAGIVVPLILSSLLLLVGISYCARQRSRATTNAPRTSDLEEGKPYPSSPATYPDSLPHAHSMGADGRVAYPGYDHNGVSVIPRGGSEMREVPSFNITHASPIADGHPGGGMYGHDSHDGSEVINDEPGSLAVPDMRGVGVEMEGAYAHAPNVLYSDGQGNILAPLGSLTPVRIVDTHAHTLGPPSTASTTARCLTPRSAAEVEVCLGDLPASFHSHHSSTSHRGPSGAPSSATSATGTTRGNKDEPWKCQDCGSAKLLRATSVDRQSSFFSSTYWSPSRRSSQSTDFAGYEEVCSCPPKSTHSSSRSGTPYPRSAGTRPPRESRADRGAPSSSSSASSAVGPCSCSDTSCASTVMPRAPPPSLKRHPHTRRRSVKDGSSSSCDSLPFSGRSSPEIPHSLRLGRPSSSSSSGSSTACSHAPSDPQERQKAATKWLHHVDGNAAGYAGSIATEGHGHTCASHSHHTRATGSARSYTIETARSVDLPSPWAPLRPKHKKEREEWRWERVPVAVYDALERTETRSSVDTRDRMWRR